MTFYEIKFQKRKQPSSEVGGIYFYEKFVIMKWGKLFEVIIWSKIKNIKRMVTILASFTTLKNTPTRLAAAAITAGVRHLNHPFCTVYSLGNVRIAG
jgi:hypothetical protein